MIDRESFPTLWKALKLIDLDCGLIVDEHQHSMDLIDVSNEDAVTAEEALALLDDEELEIFCTGNEEQQKEIADRSVELTIADEVLRKYFDLL